MQIYSFLVFSGVHGTPSDHGITDETIQTTPAFNSSVVKNVLQTESNYESDTDTNRNQDIAEGHQPEETCPRNDDKTYYKGFELDNDVRSELVNFVNSDVSSGMSPGQLSKIIALADQLMLNVIQIREEAAFSEIESQEMHKRRKTLIFYNVPVSKSETHTKRIAHDTGRIREFLRNYLGIDNVKILYLKRFKGNWGLIKVSLQNEHIVSRILKAQTAMINAGKKSEIFCTMDRAPLDHICKKQLTLQTKVRNKISEFRSDPWRWRNFKSRTVPYLPNTSSHNVDHMEELADEIKYLVKRLKLLVRNDPLEIQQRRENLKFLLIFNLEESKCPDPKECQAQDEHKVKMICDFLEADFSKVARVTPVDWEPPNFAPVPLRITFTDSTLRYVLQDRAPLLKQSLVPWMKPVYFVSERTTVERYIHTFLIQEMKLRNEICKISGRDPKEWMIFRDEVRPRNSKFGPNSL